MIIKKEKEKKNFFVCFCVMIRPQKKCFILIRLSVFFFFDLILLLLLFPPKRHGRFINPVVTKKSNIFFSSVPQMMIAETIAITIATKHLLRVHLEEMRKLIVISFFYPLSGNNIVVIGSINYRNR